MLRVRNFYFYFFITQLPTPNLSSLLLTWMKYLAHRHGEVAFGFKVLWHGSVVSRLDSPIGVEVIDPGGVWPATGQHGRPTGCTHSLLSRGVIKKKGGVGALNISKPCDPNGIELKKAPEL